MAHEPNRFVADAQHPVNLMSTHALLAGVHQVRDKKPAVQRDMRILENGTDGDAELFTASVALPHALANWLLGCRTRFQKASVIEFSAMWTDRAFGPADRLKQ